MNILNLIKELFMKKNYQTKQEAKTKRIGAVIEDSAEDIAAIPLEVSAEFVKRKGIKKSKKVKR